LKHELSIPQNQQVPVHIDFDAAKVMRVIDHARDAAIVVICAATVGSCLKAAISR